MLSERLYGSVSVMADLRFWVDVITGVARRRGISTGHKLAVVSETMQPGVSIRYVALWHVHLPSFVFQ